MLFSMQMMIRCAAACFGEMALRRIRHSFAIAGHASSSLPARSPQEALLISFSRETTCCRYYYTFISSSGHFHYCRICRCLRVSGLHWLRPCYSTRHLSLTPKCRRHAAMLGRFSFSIMLVARASSSRVAHAVDDVCAAFLGLSRACSAHKMSSTMISGDFAFIGFDIIERSRCLTFIFSTPFPSRHFSSLRFRVSPFAHSAEDSSRAVGVSSSAADCGCRIIYAHALAPRCLYAQKAIFLDDARRGCHQLGFLADVIFISSISRYGMPERFHVTEDALMRCARRRECRSSISRRRQSSHYRAITEKIRPISGIAFDFLAACCAA